MPRRSKNQIALDCGLSPGTKPSALQIRQSKELTRNQDASMTTATMQPPKLPKLKVPASTSNMVGTPSTFTIPATHAKPIVRTKSKPVNKEIESEEIDVNEQTNSPRFNHNDLDHLLGLMAMQENQDCLFGSGSITAVDGMT